ncbi:DUF317 domain-containing protein [Streptomyces tsukubensis]|uniref:DUF317 domain-containing protein n=1 Tax=Streptomyces tsukubensis TaxID=83656 RepID=UPI0036A6F7BC
MTEKITVEQALISPRALAGGGDPGWVTVPLHRAGGWSYGHDPLQPRVLLSSPDQRMLLRLEPDPDGQWWTFQHTRTGTASAWYASFGARTPVEAIAGFTDAVTHPHTAPTVSDPHVPLLAQGWLPGRDRDGLSSPDGFAHVEHFTTEGAGSWFITAAVGEDPEGQLWKTRFSAATPLPLIAAFTRALADPTPLARDPLHLPAAIRTLARITRHEVPADTLARALEQRIQQLTAPDVPSSATQPRAPRVPPPHRRHR